MTPTTRLSSADQLSEILGTMNPDSPRYLVCEMKDAEAVFIRDLASQRVKERGQLRISRAQAEWLADIHHKAYRQAHPRK